MKKRLSALLIKALTLCLLTAALVPINSYETDASDMTVYIKSGEFSNGDVYTRYDLATIRNYNLSNLEFDMDFRCIDKFYYDCWFNNMIDCSHGTPGPGNKQYQVLEIQGKKTYTFDLMNYNSTELHKSDEYYIANEGYGVEHAIFNAYVPLDKCSICTGYINRCTTTGYFYLVDCRGSAKMASTYNVSAGGSVTVFPEYNEYAESAAWGIKFSGSDTFTPLSDGKLENGIIVSGSQTKQLVLSNMPKKNMQFYVGAYIYDKDKQLPTNATYPDTKFYSKINVYYDGPEEEETDISDTNNTGGNTGTNSENDTITSTGGTSDSPNVTKDNGGNNTGSEGTSSGNNNPSNDTPSSLPAGNATQNTPAASDSENTPAGTLLEYKETSKKDGYITGTVIRSPSEKSTVSVSSSSKTGTNTSDGANAKTGSPKLLSETEKNRLFDEIRNNSHEYITNSETSKRNLKENAADNDSNKLKLSSLENTGDEELFENSEGGIGNDFSPDVKHKSVLFYAVIITVVILFLLLLLFVLFFGVIIVADKENELIKMSEGFNVKVPVGIRLVTIFNGEWAINFGELLSNHDVLDVYLGILFAYVYEGEQIKILTKFKGESKKEIAAEKIARQLSVGSKRGGNK